MRLAAAIALSALTCLASGAGADDKLPVQLAGTGSTMLDSGKKTTAPWSIAVVSQDEDGNLKGTMNWSGGTCQLSNTPFAGTYRNGVLEISASSTNARCGAITMTLTKSATERFLLEGTARFHASKNPAAVTLRPR
ncbi:MAG: hypothetical protein ACRETU_03155 [Steroidobacterales bacterium]